MKFKNRNLDMLAGSHNQIMAFDCEFWRITKSSGFISIPGTDEFFIPRELGGFIFKKSGDEWEYNEKPFFITFLNPRGYDVSFVSSQFATVSDKTAEELDQYQSLLQIEWHRSFLSSLPNEQHVLLKDSLKIYNSDDHIKKNHKPPSWIKQFMEVYSKSFVIVKGTSDIEALENMCRIHKYEYKPPAGVYDVAEWNLQSRKRCRTAKLEGTYDCIKKDVDDRLSNGKRLRDILPMERAHEPTTDASMTLLVALYIISSKKK
jgi:hypothetical protein